MVRVFEVELWVFKQPREGKKRPKRAAEKVFFCLGKCDSGCRCGWMRGEQSEAEPGNRLSPRGKGCLVVCRWRERRKAHCGILCVKGL